MFDQQDKKNCCVQVDLNKRRRKYWILYQIKVCDFLIYKININIINIRHYKAEPHTLSILFIFGRTESFSFLSNLYVIPNDIIMHTYTHKPF